jgi:hypothetical protein
MNFKNSDKCVKPAPFSNAFKAVLLCTSVCSAFLLADYHLLCLCDGKEGLLFILRWLFKFCSNVLGEKSAKVLLLCYSSACNPFLKSFCALIFLLRCGALKQYFNLLERKPLIHFFTFTEFISSDTVVPCTVVEILLSTSRSRWLIKLSVGRMARFTAVNCLYTTCIRQKCCALWFKISKPFKQEILV